jgi:hypothetical protein
VARTFSLDTAALTAQLKIPEDRAEPVLTSLASVYALIDRLDDLDMAETPPATAFDARWE